MINGLDVISATLLPKSSPHLLVVDDEALFVVVVWGVRYAEAMVEDCPMRYAEAMMRESEWFLDSGCTIKPTRFLSGP